MLFLVPLALSLLSQQAVWPQTRAERTNFAETSHYYDVIDFITALDRAGAPIRLQWSGTSTEGRKIPLVIASRPLVKDVAEAKASGKPIIYIQANIHAGEVEGKEAALALLRRYSQEKSGILDKTILLVAPIYNIDGNEKFGPQERNRPGQNGPEIVGLRANGQGLDLNRDCVKAESPEMQGVLKNVYSWDPDVIMDLHTTDGTRHAYQMTYSPSLYPNTDPDVMTFTRDELIPKVKAEVLKQGLRMFDYGNAEKRGEVTVWSTFGNEARYVTNYAGLRNRVSILTEAMVHEPFNERVEDTELFVDSLLREIAAQGPRVVAMTRAADARVVAWGNDAANAPELGVRFDFASRGFEDVLLEKGPPPTDSKQPIREWETKNMEVFDRFTATRKAKFPSAYLISPSASKVADLLKLHGVKVERPNGPWEGSTERFVIKEFVQDERAFQGHKLIRLEGQFETVPVVTNGEWFMVRTAQPLGTLAFHLLEPEGLDGAMAWGFFGETMKAGDIFPVVKAYART